MQPKTVVVSLPVTDVDRSLTFYRDGLGLTPTETDESMIAFELPNLSLFLIERGEFGKYTARAGVAPHAPGLGAAECVLSCAIGSRKEVDDILERAAATGGSTPNPASDLDGAYIGHFRDPDGHVWELVYNAETQAAPSPS